MSRRKAKAPVLPVVTFGDTAEVRAEHARRRAQNEVDMGRPEGDIGPRFVGPSIGDCIHCGRPMQMGSSSVAYDYGLCDDCHFAD